MNDLLQSNHAAILRIARKHGVKTICVFGSSARNELRDDSDVDFLIEVDGPTSPWFPGGLVAELEQLLNRRVDVVEACALREPLREIILKEAVPL